MNWMMKFWNHRYQSELATARRRLLGEVIQHQRFARLEATGGVEVEVPVERLRPGDVILVAAGAGGHAGVISPLAFVAVTMPPWPGEHEGYRVTGPWTPTVD